jgi:HK97 family phage prohead protease
MKKKFDFERRYVLANEIRMAEEKGTIEGHAAVFNSMSQDLGGFFEFIRPGAFAKTIKEADIRALWNHNDHYVLGRNTAGTLELSEDEIGLRSIIHPPKATWADDLRESIKRKDVTQMSFGFRTIKDEWFEKEGKVVRELIEVQLFDVSPVTFPAYQTTDVSARALSAAGSGENMKLFKALCRLNRGEQLSPEDLEMVKKYEQELRAKTGEPEPVIADHSAPKQEPPQAKPAEEHSYVESPEEKIRRCQLAELELK